MSSCKHPIAHPRHQRGAVMSSVPTGKRKITAEMALSINKYYRKRYKGKVSTLKQDDLLCKTCYATELRRLSNKKSLEEDSSSEELEPNFQATASPSLLPSQKRMRTSSPTPSNSFDTEVIGHLHKTSVAILKQSTINSVSTISSTDTSSPSDIETKHNFYTKSNKEKFNSLLKVLNVSPVKDTRMTSVTQEKNQKLLREIKILSTSFSKSTSSSTGDTTLTNNIDYEDMEHLVLGLKQLILMSDHSERIRLLTICPSTWSRREITNHFAVSEWESRMAIELRESNGVLSLYENNQDRGELTPTTIKAVLDFYEDDTISRCSSNSKDTINIKQNNGEKKPIFCRYMLMSLTEAFEMFKLKYENHPDIKIGHTKFCYLRPKWVKLSIKKNICLCHFHENFRLLLVTFSTVIQTSLKSHSFVEQIVCSRENSLCMYGDCILCQMKIPSTEMPKLYPHIDLDEGVSWMKWAKLNGKLDIHRITGSVHDLLLEMDHQWMKFITHSYITNAQFEYIRQLKEALAVDTALVHMDFAENYALEVQNEIMSKHWSTSQAALFTIQIKTKLQISNVVIISDYLNHDTIFVHCAQKLICDHIKNNYPAVKTIMYLSDGCSGHFKNNLSLLNLVNHFRDFEYKAEWIFYSTSHGKGAVDGLGAVVKSAARRETMRAGGPEKSLLTPVEFYKFSKGKFNPKGLSTTTISLDSTAQQQQKDVKIHIWYLSESEVTQHFQKYLSSRWDARSCTGPIYGIRSFHHFQPVDSETIRCRITSNALIYQDFSMFPSKQHKLKHVNKVFTVNDVKIDDFVVVEYDECWWLAIIQDIEFNLKELKIAFLHPSGPRTSFQFPKKPDELNVELTTIVCKVNQTPKLGTRNTYLITLQQLEEIEEIFSQN